MGSWGPWAKEAMKVAIGEGVGHHLCPRVLRLVLQDCSVSLLALFPRVGGLGFGDGLPVKWVTMPAEGRCPKSGNCHYEPEGSG